MQSQTYNVAALLNVSRLEQWYNRNDCASIRKIGSKNIVNVLTSFFVEKLDAATVDTTTIEPEKHITTVSHSSTVDSMDHWLDSDDNYASENDQGSELISVVSEKERIEFLKIIENDLPFEKSTKNATISWKKNRVKKFPMIARLASLLLNIPSSAAHIERFYSICGNVCEPKRGNMNHETIILRSILKANMGILSELVHKT
jgi:hypothetical protein